MQNFSNPQTPPGVGYGAPPPAKKSGLSKGCIIGIIAAVVIVIVGIVLIFFLFVGSAYLYKRQAQSPNSGTSGTTTSSTSSSSSSSSDDSAESPAPTSAQAAAIAGGQAANWEQQEMSWTLPQKWSKQSADSKMFFWRSPGSFDAASLIVSISPMSADFPAEASIKAFYDGAQTRKQNGEVDEVRWLKLGGVKGVQFRESAPESADNPQRLQWMAYRNYKGQVQLINVMLATRGKDFARHEDALYGILYSTNFSH
jgi:hypothetical protein